MHICPRHKRKTMYGSLANCGTHLCNKLGYIIRELAFCFCERAKITTPLLSLYVLSVSSNCCFGSPSSFHTGNTLYPCSGKKYNTLHTTSYIRRRDGEIRNVMKKMCISQIYIYTFTTSTYPNGKIF